MKYVDCVDADVSGELNMQHLALNVDFDHDDSTQLTPELWAKLDLCNYSICLQRIFYDIYSLM